MIVNERLRALSSWSWHGFSVQDGTTQDLYVKRELRRSRSVPKGHLLHCEIAPNAFNVAA